MKVDDEYLMLEWRRIRRNHAVTLSLWFTTIVLAFVAAAVLGVVFWVDPGWVVGLCCLLEYLYFLPCAREVSTAQTGVGPMSYIPVLRNGRLYVCAEMCSTCVFRPGNLMQLHRGRVAGMVRGAVKNESCIPCHHHAYTETPAVCRGFFDLHPTQPLQVLSRLGLVTYVDAETGEDIA